MAYLYKEKLKKIEWLAFAIFIQILLSSNQLFAQNCNNYTVTRTTSIVYNSIAATGTSFPSWRNTTSLVVDDNRSNPVNIGFDFYYLGQRYTQFCVSTNGFIDFNVSNTSDGGPSPGPYGYENSQFSTASGTRLALAPYYDDLTTQGATDPLGTSLKYQVDGTQPNRVLTVEWLNMAVYGNTTPNLNFQVKLYESTGVIEFIYGSMVNGTASWSYTSGINALSGSTGTAVLWNQNPANSSTFVGTASNSLAILPASNSMIRLTPPAVANPSGLLTFTGVAASAMTLNWADWASGELGYVVYGSEDNIDFEFYGQLPANSTSYTATNLTPSTLYYWRVYAISEGSFSTALTGSQSTLAPGNIVSLGSGLWSQTSTWSSGTVPTDGDNVIINNTHNITVDMNAECFNLTVGQGISGSLTIGNDATARNMTVSGNLVVSANGSFQNNNSFNATNILNLRRSITNNGVINFNQAANRVTNVRFIGNQNRTISGSGSTYNFNLVEINLSNPNRTIELFSSTVTFPNNFLTLTSGIFKLSPTSALTIVPFSAANSNIESNAELWLNSNNITVNTTNGNLNVYGNLRVSSGTINVGNAANNNLQYAGGTISLSGGLINVAGRFDRLNITTVMILNVSGGELRINTVGSTSTTRSPFHADVFGSTLIMSNGVISIEREGGSGAEDLGVVQNFSGTTNLTGGSIQLGTSATPASQTMRINCPTPFYNFNIGSNNVTASIVTEMYITNQVALLTGTLNHIGASTLRLGGNFTVTSGVYTPGTGTILFTIGNNQIVSLPVSAFTFNNITVDKSGGDISTGGSLNQITCTNYTHTNGNSSWAGMNSVTASTLTVQGGNLNIASLSQWTNNGNVVLSGGTFTGPVNFSITGNWTNNGGTFDGGTNTVTFTGGVAQVINGTATSQIFGNIEVNKSANALTIGGSTTSITTNNLLITNGTFTGSGTININGNLTQNGGTFTLPPNLFLAGATSSIFINAGTFTVTGNTLHFTGSGNQTFNGTIASQTFNNITVNKTGGILNAGGSITSITCATFTSTNGTTQLTGLNAVTSTSLVVNGGNLNVSSLPLWTNNGNTTLAGGTFTGPVNFSTTGNWTNNGGTFDGGTNTVTFTGGNNHAINGTAVTQNFGNVVINKSGNTLTVAGSTTTLNISDLTNTNGNFNATGASNGLYVNNFLQSAGTFTLPDNFYVAGNHTRNGGTYTSGAGTVIFNGSGNQQMNGTQNSQTFNNINFNRSGGTITVGGSLVTLTTNNLTQTAGDSDLSALTTLNINSAATSQLTLDGGTIIPAPTTNIRGGLTCNNAATLNPSTFTIAFTANNNATIQGTADSVVFNNLTFSKGGGTLSIAGSIGKIRVNNNLVISTGGTINLTGLTNGIVVSGNTTLSGGTFTTGGVPINIVGTFTSTGGTWNSGTSTINVTGTFTTNGGTFNLNDGTINLTGNYTISNGTFNVLAGTLNIDGNYSQTNGTFSAGTGNIYLKGATSSLSRTAGTFNSGASSTLHFTGTGAQTYNAAYTLRNLTVNKPSGTFTLNSNMTIDGTLTINQGIMDANTRTLGTNGSLTMTGGELRIAELVATAPGLPRLTGAYNITGGTILFNGAGNQLIRSLNTAGSAQYFNIEIGGSGTKTFNGNTTIAGNLNYTSATLAFGTTITTFAGSSEQQISGNITFPNLTINNTGAGVTLNNEINVATQLTLTNGNINTTSTNVLNINAGAASTAGNANSYINGPLRKTGNTTFVFPVGKNGRWARLEMIPTSGYAAGTQFTCEYFDSAGPNYNNPANMGTGIAYTSQQEHWDLERTFDVGNDAACNIRLYWEDNTFSGINNMADLRMTHYNSSTSKWEDHGGVGIDLGGGKGTITSTIPITSFSPISFGSSGGANPLPVSLLYFKGECINDISVLNWETASEINNDKFEIEKSLNGLDWYVIAEIPGAGFSNKNLQYQFKDTNPNKGITYYRLKQIDYNGTFEYFNTVLTKCEQIGNQVAVYPNPNTGKFFIENLPENSRIAIYNTQGKLIFEKLNNNLLEMIDLGNAANGIYFLHIHIADSASSGTIFKLIVRK